MSREVFLDAPDVGKAEKEYLSRAIESGYVSSVGPFVPRFEKIFADYLGSGKAVSTQSGTAAIHVSLYELGIGSGDEVIVPALTFVATVNPVVYVGATPVFVDVDLKTWNIDPAGIEKSITRRTKAIIPVHLYGNPCDMERLVRIAKKYKLFIIEDATESLGARYRGRYTGTFGDLGCFSFNGNKVITTGGGGMVVGRHSHRIDRIRFLINQAREESAGYFHSEIGFNYRMTNIEAAMGLAQMEKLRGFLKKKKEFNAIYREELEGFKGIKFQEQCPCAENSYWMNCVLFKNKLDVNPLQVRLEKKGISTRRVFMPLPAFPYFKIYDKKGYRSSEYIYDHGLCLPCSTLNSAEEIRYVCTTIKGLLK